MSFFKIRKGDLNHYTFKLNFDTPKEGSTDKFNKKRFSYGVTNMLSNEMVNLDASETMHKQLSQFRKGDILEMWYTQENDSLKFHCQRVPQQIPAPQAAPSAPGSQPITRDERIDQMFAQKRDSIHAQTALRLAVDTLSVADKDRPWNTDVKIIIQERKRFFLEEIEAGIKSEPAPEVPNPEDFGD